MSPCCRTPRRGGAATASLLSAAALVLFPKCPFCLAAGLSLATGLTFTAPVTAGLRAIVLLLVPLALFVVAPRFHGDRLLLVQSTR